ncbi:MAG: Rrf2 family transcriptional regulator [Treponema sp.]|nr:Rrf2 family transcriptional regulator [Treponema sp.]
MKITTRGRYALRATLALAQLGKNSGPVSINTLSEQERISPIFLEQIFFKLRKAGIVASARGPGGGFFFEKPLEEITLKSILKASGEEMETVPCDKRAGNCERISTCLSHKVWSKVNKLVDDYFINITLARILEGNIDNAKSC